MVEIFIHFMVGIYIQQEFLAFKVSQRNAEVGM